MKGKEQDTTLEINEQELYYSLQYVLEKLSRAGTLYKSQIHYVLLMSGKI